MRLLLVCLRIGGMEGAGFLWRRHGRREIDAASDGIVPGCRPIAVRQYIYDTIGARCRSSELVDSDSAEWDSDHEADTDAQQQLGEWLGQLQVLSNVSLASFLPPPFCLHRFILLPTIPIPPKVHLYMPE